MLTVDVLRQDEVSKAWRRIVSSTELVLRHFHITSEVKGIGVMTSRLKPSVKIVYRAASWYVEAVGPFAEFFNVALLDWK